VTGEHIARFFRSLAEQTMHDRIPIPLKPALAELNSPEFKEICGWPFVDPFVGRLLRDDIPQRMFFGNGRTWVYRDPENRLVGFGTIDVCEDCAEFTAGKPHPYIPLLAANPTIQSRGYGTSIVRHLIGEAVLLTRQPHGCHDILFLDVYTTNDKAIGLYEKCGFETMSPEPILDSDENGALYIIMAKRLTIAVA
jgi:ribosomal protein S18 acetylase RimI-like enzyme